MIGFLLQLLSELLLAYVVATVAVWLSAVDNRARFLAWFGLSFETGSSDGSSSGGDAGGSNDAGNGDSDSGSSGGGDSGGGGGGD